MVSRFNCPSFDIYSKRISFFFNNHEKIGSFSGYFLTLTFIIISIVLFAYQIAQTIQRNELVVYDSTMYGNEMPSIEINSDQLYFAFGLEEPSTSNRFIDDRIYFPKIVFVDKIKINDELVTANQVTLDYEKCNVEKFGENYQHLFLPHELDNSYCLKDTNLNLTLAGGYKYERFSYIRIRIYPCVNSTENNHRCKPQEVIDQYLSSGYFSIIVKDIGLNPLNYSSPILPTLQDLYTTIDKRIYKNYILNFRVTEISTDTGLITEEVRKNKYLQYFKELQTFTFRDEEEYYSGKSVILVQIKLDDTILIQRRIYTKISEIFSRIGGYMQLINTIFLLLSSIINKIHSSLIIINSIFKFNIKRNKMILRFHPINELNTIIKSRSSNYLVFSSKNSIENIKQLEYFNKSKNDLISRENDYSHVSSFFNISENKKMSINEHHKHNKNSNQINIIPFENEKINTKNSNSITSDKRQKLESMIFNNKESLKKNDNYREKKETYNIRDFNERIDLNVFYYLLCNRSRRKNNLLELYNLGNNYYRKKMDIVHVFTLLSIMEKILSKNNF
jgi:hypothetical protein